MSLISSPFNFGFNDKRSSVSFYNKVTTLPRIPHPLTLINDQDKNSLNIRGKSRNEYLIPTQRSNSCLSNHSRRSSSLRNYSISPQIPENVDIVYGEDRDQIRLPIFGRRPSSIQSSRLENGKGNEVTSRRIEIGELESILKEKVRSQLHDVRTKFVRSVDFDSNGKISREAFKHIIASIFGVQRQISPNQMEKLLERLRLKDLTKISFDEFLNCLSLGKKNSSNSISRQSSPSEQFLTKRTSGQMFIILKDKLRTKNKDLLCFCPALNGGPPSTIFKSQFHNALIDMGYRMKDKEFDKLWDKFDPDGFHVINSEKFVKRLTNEELVHESSLIGRSETQDQQSAILKSSFVINSNSDCQIDSSSGNSDRNQFNENYIDKWLNNKVDQCLPELERSFHRLDRNQSGTLSQNEFIEELKHFGLFLKENLLDLFFKRLNVDLTLKDQIIPYENVLYALKQRIDLTKKRNQVDKPLPEENIRQTSLEQQVQYLISKNYQKILEKMRRFDLQDDGTINNNEMRSIIEDLLEFPLRHDEYHQLFKQFPTDQNGKIQYKDYLKQSLDHINFKQQEEEQEKQNPSIKTIPQWDYMRSNNIRESLKQENIRKKISDKSIDSNLNEEEYVRSIQQLNQILKTLVRTRSKDIEDEFKKIDYGSYGELTQQLLYELFKRLRVQPEISRKEILLLWSTFYLKQSQTLDFDQFLRQFGYSKQSAHYPNSKENPPQRGDSDFLLTSNKLYANSILIHDTLRHAIKSNWNEIRIELTQLDPFRTGFVHLEEFYQILSQFSPSINQQDLQILQSTFDTQHDSRINYVQFLKHHAPTTELIDEIDQSRRRSVTTIADNSARISSDRSLLNDVSNKLRRKLSDCYKSIRRSFKEEDLTNCGSVSIKIFKDVLNQFKCPLNDEEFYVLISQLDTKLNGSINYNYFLQQYIKNT